MGMRGASIVCLLLLPAITSAQVVITEIMYDLEGGDSNREWVEVQNTGTEVVTFADWKLFENKTNHGITSISGETLSPGSYAIIADDAEKFKSDWPSYTGLLFDSAFSLNNTGEALLLRCCGKEPTDRDSVSYLSEQGGAGDGSSLHRSGSAFTSGKPSPGTGAVIAVAPLPPPLPSQTPPPAPPPPPQPQQTAPTTTQAVPAPVSPMPPTVQNNVVETPQTVTSTPARAESTPPPKKKTPPKKPAPQVAESIQEVEEKALPAPVAQTAAAPLVASSRQDSWMWWGGAVAISLLGAYGAFALGKTQASRKEKEWEIEEID